MYCLFDLVGVVFELMRGGKYDTGYAVSGSMLSGACQDLCGAGC